VLNSQQLTDEKLAHVNIAHPIANCHRLLNFVFAGLNKPTDVRRPANIDLPGATVCDKIAA
jgi:hypothetical protein